jgi:hypothetical protein
VPERPAVPAATATEMQVLLDFVQPDDTLVVTRINRLGRSMKALQDIVYELKGRGVALRSSEQPVETGTAAGKALIDILGVFAEFEINLRRERQLEGIALAKTRGVYRGRKLSVDTPRSDGCGMRREKSACLLRDNQGEKRIASPEMLPSANLLPHSKYSPAVWIGGVGRWGRSAWRQETSWWSRWPNDTRLAADRSAAGFWTNSRR